MDESEAYSVYGYSVSMSGDVDTSTIGMYNIDYALTRTYTSGDDTITTAPMSETRAVEVVDRSAYMITEWNIWDNIKTIKLPISGDANITVDWGDGSDIEFISGTFDSSNFPTHTYAENGTYDIAVKGSLEEWGHNVSRYEEIPDGDPYKTYYGYMKGVKQWGALGATRYGFSNCIYMEYVSGDATEDTFKNVTDMSYMFVNCYELKTIDLSNFDTSNVTNMEFMFGVCEALETIDLSSFDTSKVTNMKYMFGACESLETIDLSGFNTKAVTNMVSLFEGCTNLVTVKFGDKFVTNNVTDMAAMFYGCTNLKNVDLTRFDTSSVENMEYMFYKCNTLESINLSSFDTSNVKSMTAMFYDCQSLKELDLSNFNTSNVTGMYIMFGECSSLEKLDISSFDTRNVKDMYGLFAFCSSLKEIDLTSFNTENVEYTGQMFDGCTSLTYLDLTGFDTSNVVDMWSMFYDATNLESILITNKFVVPDGCDFEDMFVNTTNLNAIIITSETPMGRQFANVKDQVADKIFYVPNKSVEAYKLEFSGDISGDNIKPIIELIGDEKINLLKGNAYEEKNYTVAGFGIEEIEKYMVYGYSVEVDGTVDINTAGEYVLRYTLTRTVGAGPVSTLPNAGTGSAGAQQTGDNGTTETNVVTRTIVVYDAPIVKLYENGKKYNGNWTSNDVYAVTTILSEKTTWVAVKVGSSNWNVDPEYAEITQSGDVVTVTFKQTMNDNIYLREVDAAGHATTYETAGNMVKIDKESPVIGEVKSVTEDKVLKIKAAATDKASGVKDYAVSTKATLPAEVDFREYTEDGVVCDVANTGIYYLWVRDYANNVASGEVLATKDVEPPKGMIEIVATNILSGDGYENVIVVAPNIISGEKYTNQDVVTINILVTDNETAKERIMFALYNEEDYAEVKDGTREIEWQQFKPSVEWQLKEAQGENIIYAIFKDVAGNTSVSIKEIE